ncbi:MAG TPA: adenine phosphoribosyltransferase [bacterium]|nr:adenine phosphoribosyltransferase [bacterium]
MEELKKIIREVPDFPKPGILFYDITTLLGDADAFSNVIEILAERYEGRKPARVVAVDARGFIFGGALAFRLGVSFVPVRKKGKLPWETVSASYELEYGVDEVHMHRDAILPGEPVVIVDDLLATGGTAKATIELVKKCGGEVMECAFVVELDFLNGREKLKPTPVFSILHYDK